LEAAAFRLIFRAIPAFDAIACTFLQKGSSMQLTSILCRAQEAHQHALAAASSLANVKAIAVGAAAAWAKEAHAAEKRELRFDRRQAQQLAAIPLDVARLEDRWMSENPDRGFSARAARI
jgi:hypothetical protein